MAEAETTNQEKLEHAKAEQSARGFEYSWCETDHKDGKNIREDFRSKDYIQNEPYASSVKKMLERMGLPHPDIDQVFRGTHHDLLFIESHGVVIRIGPTNVADLVNPAILQPLGWLDDSDNNFSIAIYPGIELYQDYEGDKSQLPSITKILDDTGQTSHDVENGYNKGIIRITRDSQTIPVPILLDADNQFNSTSNESKKTLKSSIFSKHSTGKTAKEPIQEAMTAVYDVTEALENWKAAFELHQPLRTMFWLAFKDCTSDNDMPNPHDLQRFWDRCKRIKQTPENVLVHQWGQRTSENGIKIDTYQQKLVEGMTLYTPFTGKAKDRMPKFVGKRQHWNAYINQVAENPELYTTLPQEVQTSTAFATTAINVNSDIVKHLPLEMTADTEFSLYLIKKNYADLKDLDPDIFANDTFLAGVMKHFYKKIHDWRHLDELESFLPADTFQRKTIIKEIIAHRYFIDPALIERIGSDFLINNADIAMATIKKEPRVYKDLPPRLQKQDDIIEAALADGDNYQYLPKAHRKNEDVFLKCLKISPFLLKHAPKEIRKNKNAVKAAVCRDEREITYAAPEILQDISFMAELMTSNPEILSYMSQHVDFHGNNLDILDNKDFVIQVLQQAGDDFPIEQFMNKLSITFWNDQDVMQEVIQKDPHQIDKVYSSDVMESLIPIKAVEFDHISWHTWAKDHDFLQAAQKIRPDWKHQVQELIDKHHSSKLNPHKMANKMDEIIERFQDNQNEVLQDIPKSTAERLTQYVKAKHLSMD